VIAKPSTVAAVRRGCHPDASRIRPCLPIRDVAFPPAAVVFHRDIALRWELLGLVSSPSSRFSNCLYPSSLTLLSPHRPIDSFSLNRPVSVSGVVHLNSWLGVVRSSHRSHGGCSPPHDERLRGGGGGGELLFPWDDTMHLSLTCAHSIGAIRFPETFSLLNGLIITPLARSASLARLGIRHAHVSGSVSKLCSASVSRRRRGETLKAAVRDEAEPAPLDSAHPRSNTLTLCHTSTRARWPSH